jgi:hypothetical protein
MKTIFLLLLLSSGSFAGEFKAIDLDNQQPVPPATSAPSYYDNLNGYFTNGLMPSFSEIQGIWSGRCYNATTPNEPKGMLLMADFVTTLPADNGNNGPLFPPPPPTTSFNMALGSRGDEAADTWDNPTPAALGEVKAYMDSPDFRSMVANYQNGSIVSNNEAGGLQFLIRKFSNYFVAQNIILRDDPASQVKAGTVFAACYFFKKIN